MFGKIVLAGALAATASLALAQEVRIGVNLPYTGVGAELAQQIDRGMEQYLKLQRRCGEAVQAHIHPPRREGPERR